MKESRKTKLKDAKEFLYKHRYVILGTVIGAATGSAIGIAAYKKGRDEALYNMLAAIHCDKDQASKWAETIISKYWTPAKTKRLESYAQKEWKPFFEEFLKEEGVA